MNILKQVISQLDYNLLINLALVPWMSVLIVAEHLLFLPKKMLQSIGKFMQELENDNVTGK